MTTTTTLTNSQSSERHKHGHKLARLANAVSHHLCEFNAMRAELSPYANRVNYAIEQYNNAIADANQFLTSIGYSGPPIPMFCVAIPGEIEYDNADLDVACERMSELEMGE